MSEEYTPPPMVDQLDFKRCLGGVISTMTCNVWLDSGTEYEAAEKLLPGLPGFRLCGVRLHGGQYFFVESFGE